MYCELYRCKGRVINGRIYMYIGSHLISESAIGLFQLYDLHVIKQHEPVGLISSCIRSNTVGSSFRLLHSFVK